MIRGGLPTIRRAVSADMEVIGEILRENDLPTDDLSESGVEFLVAEGGGTVVGTIGLETYLPAGLLRSAAVRRSHRGLGIGVLLTRALIDEARSRSISELFLLTTTAAGFFRKMGFTETARDLVAGPVLSSRQFTGSRCSSAVVMRMELR